MSQTSIVPRRRNGKLPACEPCRIRKLAYDHTVPCQRCRGRKTTHLCVYLAASSSRSPTSIVNREASSGKRNLETRRDVRANRNDVDLQVDENRNEGCEASQLITDSTPTSNKPARFLGPTSFYAVFQENRDNLNSTDSPDTSGYSSIEHQTPHSARSGGSDASTTCLVALGIQALQQIPDEKTCDVLFARHVNLNDGWIRLAAVRLSQSMFTTFGGILSNRDYNQIRNLAQLMLSNGQNALEDEEDPQQYMSSFSGRNLRWEALGVLFTYWAYGSVSSPGNDEIIACLDPHSKDRRKVMIRFKECAALCLKICDMDGYSNPIMVYLMYKLNLLQSIITGDACPTVWRGHGALVATTLSAGLNTNPDTFPTETTIGLEARRRVYTTVYNIDKVMATMLGRPPLLSVRYSSTPLPLDLSDAALLCEDSSISAEITSLDSNGWNTNNRIHSATILRARAMFASIREGILEIALGPKLNSSEITMELKERTLSIYSQLPNVLVYRPNHLTDTDIPGSEIYIRALLRLEHLQDRFLLERLLIRNSNAHVQDLVDVCVEMLSVTLVFWKYKDRFAGLDSDFEWLVLSYAVPASGILCVELLKQTKRPNYIQCNIPRSEVIQSLSLLVAFLDWVKISAPNSNLCFGVKSIVCRVLDQVLARPPVVPDDPPVEFSVDIPFNMADYDNFSHLDLLDAFDWLN
ncbi:hypothetical protein M501DRAFT_1013590 [Patellaria atrata CBS 101060]|uniref:Xylanolytic transcriptional activator regulatory domain-containing protein n=1 Tax=Patellaria atrata CBS 101060 TaxID=1346257 RepID=A0A9P4SGT0_9PEZI|nr:hypothetical protein M501DRAFT_1013590 [Patellaria atrata CBS 101060]